jgi:hypothetical protein
LGQLFSNKIRHLGGFFVVHTCSNALWDNGSARLLHGFIFVVYEIGKGPLILGYESAYHYGGGGQTWINGQKQCLL